MKYSKSIHINIIAILVTIATFTASCEDFFDYQSNQYMGLDDNTINSENDTVFSVIGILTKIQKLADKYVLLGELRGDLLSTTEFTEEELKALNNHALNEKSTFSDLTDYYAVINNCNYFISRVDTSISVNGNKPFLKELSAVKSFRAWTYLQLALNYAKVVYYENPILNIADNNRNYPLLNIAQTIDTLIADLEPHANYDSPNYGTIFTAESKYLFINTKYLLGDLYLWKAAISDDQYLSQKANYEKAAMYYATVIMQQKYINTGFESKWTNSAYTTFIDSWSSIFKQTANNKELISIISLSETGFNGNTTQLPNYFQQAELAASQRLIDLYDEQIYAYPLSSTVTSYTYGDLRKKETIQSTSTAEYTSIPLPLKYKSNTIMIYRVGQLYLRYAEAVNRLGKPGLAFAVLKYGLKASVLSDNKAIPAKEVMDLPYYISIFNNLAFNENKGIHSRGSGNSDVNSRYTIPVTCNTLADSVIFVENAICDELALETAFEGNRFQDLMRFSEHRNNPDFLAEKVSISHNDNTTLRNLLKVKSNWFVPIKRD